MAGEPIVEQQLQQTNQIAQEILRQTIEHQQALQTVVEKKWQTSHKKLVQLVHQLDADYFDACQKSGRPIDQFNDEDLYEWIALRIKALQTRLTHLMRPDQTEGLRAQRDEALRKIESGQQEEVRLHTLLQNMEKEKQQLTTHLAAIRQVQRPANTDLIEVAVPKQMPLLETESNGITEGEPGWMREWRSGRTFARESAALILMGEAGKSLRPSLVGRLAKRLNLSPSNSSISEAFSRLLNLDASGGLIEYLDVFQQTGASTGGNHPDIFRLTDRGRQAYQYLTGKQPVEDEYERLIRKHKTPEHTVLNIQAGEVLEECGGYQLLEQAPDIQLPDGSVFIPDVIALDPKTGEMIFIEVERDAGKDWNARTRKWRNVMNATNGEIYVICDNIQCERKILTEINQALEGLPFNSRLTNLNSLNKGKRGEAGSIWLTVRHGK
jgi:hypothetical protein